MSQMNRGGPTSTGSTQFAKDTRRAVGPKGQDWIALLTEVRDDLEDQD
jgi:hypothetical protein